MSVCESTWMLELPERNTNILFMIVGFVNEPQIELSDNFIQFSPALVGTTQRKTIILSNFENEDYLWELDKLSFKNNVGKYKYGSKLPLKVSYDIGTAAFARGKMFFFFEFFFFEIFFLNL